MNGLLILGAGGFGRTAAETAQLTGQFGKIAFLDDESKGPNVLGSCCDYLQFTQDFRFAYPAFGDNELRSAWMMRLEQAGYELPVIIHPRACVSPSAVIEGGAAVLAMAVIGTGTTVRRGAIVNLGAVADHDCVLGAFSHTAPGAVIKAGNHIPDQMKVESGTVIERNTLR